MNFFTYININTPYRIFSSDEFVDDYIICNDVRDEQGNKVNTIDLSEMEIVEKVEDDKTIEKKN